MTGSLRISLINLRRLRQLAIRLQAPRLIGVILENHIALLVLVVAQREQDDVALVDPDLLAELAADVGETLFAIEAEGLETSVTQHLDDLGVFLAFLFEGQLAFFVVVLVLATTTVFTALYSEGWSAPTTSQKK